MIGNKNGIGNKGRTGQIAWNKGIPQSKRAKEKNRLAHLGIKPTEETRRKQSESRTGIKNHNYGKHMSDFTKKKQRLSHLGNVPWNKGIPCAEKTKKKISNSSMGRKSPREGVQLSLKTRKKIGDAQRGTTHTEEHKQNIRNSMNTEEMRAFLREARKHVVVPKKDSKPELFMQETLTKANIKFTKHVPLIGQPDIFIEPDLCVFVDGDYWHAHPWIFDSDKIMYRGLKAKEIWMKDTRVNHKLIKLGYRVIRIWVSDLYADIDACIKRISSNINYN